jgi:hypothetical protein
MITEEQLAVKHFSVEGQVQILSLNLKQTSLARAQT